MEIKAKNASLWGKIIGVLFIIVCSILKWMQILQNATIQEICLVGGCVMALFSTVDINLMLEKICHIKKDKESE